MLVHRRQHDGAVEKTHDCSFCGASFPRKYKLKEHLEKSHNTVLPHDAATSALIWTIIKNIIKFINYSEASNSASVQGFEPDFRKINSSSFSFCGKSAANWSLFLLIKITKISYEKMNETPKGIEFNKTLFTSSEE